MHVSCYLLMTPIITQYTAINSLTIKENVEDSNTNAEMTLFVDHRVDYRSINVRNNFFIVRDFATFPPACRNWVLFKTVIRNN